MLGVQIDESAAVLTGAEGQASIARVGVVNDEMKSKGDRVFAGGLLRSDSATVVRARNGTTTLT